ncbi:MAG TPA: hypothetical protein ENF91_00150 [Thermoplasmatales archaeon]|nr:hypothetical protein [Thermoplasmatales archaeon]
MMKNYRIMRKLAIIFIVAVLAFPLVSASVLEKPDWREGDYWKYKDMNRRGISEERIIEILGTENITVNNTTYHCIVAKEETNTSKKISYYDEESMGVIKEVNYDNETNKTEEKIYDPPVSLIQYPVFVGKEWNITVEELKANSTGKIRLDCIGKKKISVPAGTFDCYMVKTNQFPNESMNYYFYNIIYVSGRAGNIVRIEQYLRGNLTYSSELTSFHYTAGSEEQQSYNMVMIVVASIAVFVSLLALYKFKRKQ